MFPRSAGISLAFLTSDTHRRFSRSIFGSNFGKSKSSTSVFGWILVPTLNHSPPRCTEAVRISAEDQTDSSSDHNAVKTLRAWTYQYTSNRLTSVTDPLSNSTLYFYDASNRISKVIDRANKMTRIVYDTSSRVTDSYLGLYNRTTSSIAWQYRWYTISGYANTR